MKASDQSRPEKTVEANVKVTIQRDQKQPKFNNNPYTATVPETIEVGRNLDIKPSAIRGTDEDKKVQRLEKNCQRKHLDCQNKCLLRWQLLLLLTTWSAFIPG